MRKRSTRLHLLTALVLLVGWGQQLCAEVGMACSEAAKAAAASTPESTEQPSCHEAQDTAPVPVPEPRPTMACCETTDAVISATVSRASDTVADRPLEASPREGVLRPAGSSSWVPGPPPGIAHDLLMEHCRLVI